MLLNIFSILLSLNFKLIVKAFNQLSLLTNLK